MGRGGASHRGESVTLFAAATLEEKKADFLAALKSRNAASKNKYKRSLETPIRYAGGKTLAVGHIMEKLPATISRIVSPFFGGGSFEIAANIRLGLPVIGFDIFGVLVNYWRVQIAEPNRLHKSLARLSPDPETYARIKQKLSKHWKGEKQLDDFALAVHYYFNHNLSYGPGFLGWPSKIYMNRPRYLKMIAKVRDFNCPGLTVAESDFESVFQKYPGDFFYCDPPYMLGEDSKMFAGIYPQRNFPIHHRGFDHRKLCELLRNHRGGFVLSYNDCPQIREMYRTFDFSLPSWQYTMGQGETRIGDNRKAANNLTNIKKDHEIMIYSPPFARGRAKAA